MIEEILQYYTNRKYVMPTADEALMWAWTEMTEVENANNGLSRVEERGDLMMMLLLFAHLIGIDFDPFFANLQPGALLLKDITEAWLSRKNFVRNNPNKPGMENMKYLLCGMISGLQSNGYVDRNGNYITPASALRAKMARFEREKPDDEN